MKRIPSLDGLRALSITLVLCSHLVGTAGYPFGETPLLDLGNLGVRVFFVISGFLITGILLREHGKSGSIDLVQFYFKRTFRIFPAYYVYVLAAVVIGLTTTMVVDGADVLHALTYTTNYHSHRHWLVGHGWSLGVEEQFYLLWPLVILMLGPLRGGRAAIAFVFTVPALRVLLMGLPDGTLPLQDNVGFSFETVGDAIAMGCLLSLYRERLWSTPWYRRLLGSRAFVAIPLLGLAAASLDRWHGVVPDRVDFVLTGLHAAAGITVLNACIAACIDWSVRFSEGKVGRVLNQRALVTVGVYSYSLYLWQQPFLNRNHSAWWTAFPANLALTALAAFLSYQLVEGPFLRLRARIASHFTRRAPDRVGPVYVEPKS